MLCIWLETQTYLQPLAMGLHFNDHAGIRFVEGIPVWDTFAGDPQLYFGQAGAVEQAQRIGCRLVDVAHVSGDTCAVREKKNCISERLYYMWFITINLTNLKYKNMSCVNGPYLEESLPQRIRPTCLQNELLWTINLLFNMKIKQTIQYIDL